MKYISNAKIGKLSKYQKNMTINNDDTIINNDLNSFMDSSNKKSLEKKEINKSTNIVIIIV